MTLCPSAARCCATHSLSVAASTHNSHRGPSTEQGDEALARRRDASVQHFPVVHHNPDLTFLLVEIDGTIRHGWSSAGRLKSAFADRARPPVVSPADFDTRYEAD